MTEIVLVTGANGELGNSLIPELAKRGTYQIIALDSRELSENLKSHVHETIVSDILDKKIIETLYIDHKITTVFHLAGVLSTVAEKNPELAHLVNVDGTAQLLAAANAAAQNENRQIKFIFPSSIAVYGLDSIEDKKRMGKLKETDFQKPITIYGINKLYCELLGIYYTKNYNIMSPTLKLYIDFRAIRFPGIIGALTLPPGKDTNYYAPEMIHSAAKGEGYESYVRPDTEIPFVAMPDAIRALIQLNEMPKNKLTQCVYNISGFSASADQIAQLVNGMFPDSSISYSPDAGKQKIIDSWPAETDDSKAKTDWGWQPNYDLDKAFKEYLIPEIQKQNPSK